MSQQAKRLLARRARSAVSTACAYSPPPFFRRVLRLISPKHNRDTYSLGTKPKAQRRGRRLQVVEYVPSSFRIPTHHTITYGSILLTFRKVYGKASAGQVPNVALIAAIAGTRARSSSPTSDLLKSESWQKPSCIPNLQPDFLESPFYRSFHTQSTLGATPNQPRSMLTVFIVRFCLYRAYSSSRRVPDSIHGLPSRTAGGARAYRLPPNYGSRHMGGLLWN